MGPRLIHLHALYTSHVLFILLQLFSKVEDFDVTHDYLLTSNPQLQARVRKRGQNGIRVGTKLIPICTACTCMHAHAHVCYVRPH